MHTIASFAGLMEQLRDAENTAALPLAGFVEKLRQRVNDSLVFTGEDWETAYICKPSLFFNSKDSIFYAANRDMAEYECDFLLRTQLEDGSWSINWSWDDYAEQWAISKNRWKGEKAVSNTLFLRNMGA